MKDDELSDQRNGRPFGTVFLDDVDSTEFRTLRGADVRVYLAIACHCRAGAAWPRQTTLATIAGITTRQVTKSLAALEGAGFLRREPRAGDGRRVRYVLLSPPSRRRDDG